MYIDSIPGIEKLKYGFGVEEFEIDRTKSDGLDVLKNLQTDMMYEPLNNLMLYSGSLNYEQNCGEHNRRFESVDVEAAILDAGMSDIALVHKKMNCVSGDGGAEAVEEIESENIISLSDDMYDCEQLVYNGLMKKNMNRMLKNVSGGEEIEIDKTNSDGMDVLEKLLSDMINKTSSKLMECSHPINYEQSRRNFWEETICCGVWEP